MIVHLGVVVAIGVCALMSIRASRLLHAVLWLAAASALLAILLALLGAWEIAVLELSVGAGLVTVLFLLTISADADTISTQSIVPKWLALILAVGVILLIIAPVFTSLPTQETAADGSFRLMLWEQRSADVLLQIVLIFTGLLTVLGLLAEANKSQTASQLEPALVEETATSEAEEEVGLPA